MDDTDKAATRSHFAMVRAALADAEEQALLAQSQHTHALDALRAEVAVLTAALAAAEGEAAARDRWSAALQGVLLGALRRHVCQHVECSPIETHAGCHARYVLENLDEAIAARKAAR